MSDAEDQIDDLYDRALETMRKIATKRDEEDVGPVVSLLDDLEDIVDEAEDILSRIDLTELPNTIEWEELPEAFDTEDLAAMLDEDEEVMSLGKLIQVIDLTKLWGSIDTRDLWREKREFDDEMEDITDRMDTEDTADESSSRMSMPKGDFEDFDPESAEKAIQSQISGSVDEFREALLDAHVHLREFRENNKDRFKDRRRKRSRNPTFYSTLPPSRDSLGQGTRFSTVPRETRYSSAPNRERIYGNRFERATESREK